MTKEKKPKKVNVKPKPLQLQMAFTKTQQKQNDLALKRHTLRTALADVPEWQDIAEKLAGLNAKKKEILLQVKSQYPDLVKEIEFLIADLKNQAELLTDLAIRDLHDGVTVKVTGDDGSEYDPVWKVTWKKSNDKES